MKKISYCLLAMMMLTTGVSAQVTIGSGDVPKDFSVLELISNNTRGLRLPHIATTVQRDIVFTDADGFKTNPLAQGLQIFNMETRCVETWNGTVWIQSCAMDDDVINYRCPEIGDIPIPRFMAYNLGADHTLDTPKKQMAYLASAEAGGGTTTNVTIRNGRVFGGRYQWGRKNLPYAISQDGNYRLYDGFTNTVNISNITTPTYDTDGQLENMDNYHIYSENSSIDWRGNNPKDDLWGNGVAVSTATNTLPGGITYNGHTYQSPVKGKGDPCPAGWRVPTQDEWERIGAYDCQPNSAGGVLAIAIDGTNEIFNMEDGTTTPANSPFTWVPVVCGGTAGEGQCKASNDWGAIENSSLNTGYAIYKTEDWANRPDKTAEADLLSATSPEPFLFLPAAGHRNHVAAGDVSNVGNAGYYWTSNIEVVSGPSGTKSYAMTISRTQVRLNVSAIYFRAYGMSVRCVADK